MSEHLSTNNITPLIQMIRGQRVILASDLAKLYGVPTFRLNEAAKRNKVRFPSDFMFQLTAVEWDELKSLTSQNAILKRGKHQKFRPYAFTEHGALMAATVLNSPQAVAMSIYIIRAFIQQREVLAANDAILKRLAEIDKTLLLHDKALRDIYQKLLPLLQPPPDPPKPKIGFRGNRAKIWPHHAPPLLIPLNHSVHSVIPSKLVMPDPAITPELIAKHGLTPEEYLRIKEVLGREPNFTELGIFSVMWSEHCSYKNSRLELRKFPTTGPRVLVKAGEENAGVVDIGDGWGVAFKMESHNHPSAVEPFQGAATGVGGILRDIFTMGARPVFLMNSLRFGDIRPGKPNAVTNRRLLAGVVSGIAHYGNCIGVPTVGGEIYFDASYDGNPLVNVFCLGTLRTSEIRRGAATGVGNPVFYVGNRTGRDGLAGAAFASRDLTEASKEDRPAVQVGDPFIEKLLLEACLELFQHPEAVVGVQDMGAAGLTCSTCETASRGNSGIEIDLALVPQREPGMTPYETMLSESQERMLIIVRQGHEKTVLDIFEKWDIPCAQIGHVTDDGLMRVKDHGVTVAEIPAKKLADEAPLYKRDARRPADLDARAEARSRDRCPEPEALEFNAILEKLLATPDLASKRWVYRQYDHMVRVGTIIAPGSDAAVVRIPTGRKSWKYLAASVDCNAHYVALEPRLGALIAVAECARNLAMTGAEPLALTDNLNFGNPHNPENFYQLQQAVDGLAEGCRAFDIPVTGGNVSLYNQSPAGAIDPTPTVGIVGLIRDPKHITPSHFQNEGDAIILIGQSGDELGASLYLREIHNLKRGRPPELNIEREKKMHDAVRAAIRFRRCAQRARSRRRRPARCAGRVRHWWRKTTRCPRPIDKGESRLDALLFGESQGRALLTAPAGKVDALLALFNQHGVLARRVGAVGGNKLIVDVRDGASSHIHLNWDAFALYAAWNGALDSYLE